MATVAATAVWFTGEPAQAETPKPNWAILAVDSQLQTLADLLTVELSNWPDVSLVERAQVQKVLDELQLNASGLVKADRATRFGELSRADALLLLESMELPKPAQSPTGITGKREAGASLIRLRLVETVSSVRALDVVLPRAGFEADLKMILSELRSAGAKLKIPPEERQYVGILGITSEEPGRGLTTFCRTLSILLQAELQRERQVLVLEREQLERLTKERDLAGGELALRSATRLLEAGVRRADAGSGLTITCRVRSPGAAEPQLLRITTATEDAKEVLGKFVEALRKPLALRGAPASAADLEAEAAHFTKRANWFFLARRYADQAEMAEAALALSPTPQNLYLATSAYQFWVYGTEGILLIHEALPPARRLQELRLEWFRKTAPGSPLRAQLGQPPLAFEPHVRLPGTVESKEDQALRAEIDRLSKELHDVVLAEHRQDLPTHWKLLLHRLHYATYLAVTEEELVADLPPLLDQIDSMVESGHVPEKLTDSRYAKYIVTLCNQAFAALENCKGTLITQDQRVWTYDKVLPLFKKLSEGPQSVRRLAGQIGLVHAPNPIGKQAALGVMQTVRGWGVAEGDLEFVRLRCMDYALSRLHQTGEPEEHEFCEDLLKQIDERNDLGFSAAAFNSLCGYIYRTDRQHQVSMGERILAKMDRLLAQVDRSDDDTQALASRRGFLERYLIKNEVLAPRRFSTEAGPGPWKDYIARPISISGKKSNFYLMETFCPQFAGLDTDEMVLTHSVPNKIMGMNGIMRLRLDATKPRSFGPAVPRGTIPFGNEQVISFGESLAALTRAPGLFLVAEKEYKQFTEAEGAPANDIRQIAALGNRLYLSFAGGLASFDPATKRFRLIASSSALEPRSPFDGGGYYLIQQMIADPEHDCLWLAVYYCATYQRTGLWKFEAGKERFTRMDDSLPVLSRCEEGLLVKRGGTNKATHYSLPEAWAVVDFKKGEFRKLQGYAAWLPPPGSAAVRENFVKVGEHVITANGQLLTKDGKEHRLPIAKTWPHLQRVGRGFITHFDQEEGLLWYVDPKAPRQPVETPDKR